MMVEKKLLLSIFKGEEVCTECKKLRKMLLKPPGVNLFNSNFNVGHASQFPQCSTKRNIALLLVKEKKLHCMFKEFGPEKCCWLKLWLVLLMPFRIFIPEKIDLKNVKCMLRTYIPSSEPPFMPYCYRICSQHSNLLHGTQNWRT